jgi:hypothetical protein
MQSFVERFTIDYRNRFGGPGSRDPFGEFRDAFSRLALENLQLRDRDLRTLLVA